LRVPLPNTPEPQPLARLTLGVSGGSISSGAQFVEGGSTWQTYNRLTLEPIMTGEPHVLTWSHQTSDGPCGVYDWFDITRPNGTPLEDPSHSFVQLIFAGGKQSIDGTDLNPYIAQRVEGDQVAIDPTYGLNDSGSTSAGSCAASCVKVSSTNIAVRAALATAWAGCSRGRHGTP
jgi:hypothetical protein